MLLDEEGPDTLSIIAVCRQCRRDETITVGMMDYALWKGGAYIQEAMPYLTPDQREMLISNTCGPCFDRMFGAFDEEDE